MAVNNDQRVDDADRALSRLAHVHVKHTRRVGDGWSYAPVGESESEPVRLAANLLAWGVPLGLELPPRLKPAGGQDPERRRPPLDLAAIRAAVRTANALSSG